ncbi:hypothetical protein QMK19_11165 [Streptomyces sp. H10-C2]|uniref:hypothetical protein n=1 Tax=unclassified Streptomyces TaxID=2593676 RepID=UPI0024B9BD34|nr:MULTISPECIES: hypothetical protein [unclassified Streptomyces]MDJ0340570.1 hypothetical protein [Streptomyces sp. PH10-H1]MDJ0370218.1 hypothetical protein [Streptomyces sp. H10-C2]
MTPGSTRHSLAVLIAAAVVTEGVLALAGGFAVAGSGAVVITAVALLTARYVTGFDSQDHGYRRPVRLLGSRSPRLGDWGRAVSQGLSDGDGYARTLRPGLQRLYSARLAERHGISLRTQPDRAAVVVGPELWPWIDPRRPAPEGAIPPQVLRAVVDRLDDL